MPTILCPLHFDYRDRAHAIECNRTSALTLWLPAPEDLAISKLGRLSVVDMEDILQLAQLPSFSWERFRRLAMEANAYYVGRDLRSNLAYIESRRGGPT